MSNLNLDWKPEFGTIYTWFAMDKNGLISIMINNNWGDIPKVILSLDKAENLLDNLNEYIWEDSLLFNQYPKYKEGITILDLYSHLFFPKSRIEVERIIHERSINISRITEYNIPARKGFIIYHAVDGDNEDMDYPVGYSGRTKMGDYFRYLVPSIYVNTNDIPKDLWCAIAASDNLDFTKDRLLDNDQINSYFKYRVDELYKV